MSSVVTLALGALMIVGVAGFCGQSYHDPPVTRSAPSASSRVAEAAVSSPDLN